MPGTFKEDAIEGDMPGIIDAFLQKYSGARTFEVYGRDAESMATEMAKPMGENRLSEGSVSGTA